MLQDAAIPAAHPVAAQPSPGAHSSDAAQPSSGICPSPPDQATVPALNPESGPAGDHYPADYPDDASGLTLSEDAPPEVVYAKQTRRDTAESDIGEFGSVLCQGSSEMPFALHTTCASHPVYASESACLPVGSDLPDTDEIGCDEDPPDYFWSPPKHPTAPLPDKMGWGYLDPPEWYNSCVSDCTSPCRRQIGATCGLLWVPLRS